ncbi:TPA: hypothetical protein SAY52_006752 [Burkholderia cenocepacia]|uniref:hypothetical protein n=1 Tax=Burkholderia sp. BCC0801 TaxID=2676291 RepID=UPI001589B4D0|nr:hypothetical protein [Burkholderia sp. BCC0801]HEF5872515.1 hypothetical protein [Burkholderia cenocepacia]HEF5876023.1 hypothetical protein [Burkholderia cenocepacia]
MKYGAFGLEVDTAPVEIAANLFRPCIGIRRIDIRDPDDVVAHEINAASNRNKE